jgi:RNA polymerase sigma-70 factor (ECF subfamily)
MFEELSEHQLIEAARAGRRGAVEALLQRHEPRIYRFALRMCGQPEDARDVLQETLIAAYKGLGDFRGDASLSTWLFQVARSFCSKARRTRAGQPQSMESLDTPEAGKLALPETESPDERAESRETGEVLRAALATLPANYREVLLLKDVEGLSAEEVADVLGEKVPAVKSRLHRARLELRKLLTGVLGGERPETAPCPELAEELAGYAAGDIDRTTCEQMEAHMARCTRCARACDSLKATVMMCSRVEGDEVPAPIRASIRQSIAALGG